jgi:LmbE family N-acetylglucosaminyl deacetylase
MRTETFGQKEVLAIYAHPDDELITGLALQEWPVRHAMTATNGESSTVDYTRGVYFDLARRGYLCRVR